MAERSLVRRYVVGSIPIAPAPLAIRRAGKTEDTEMAKTSEKAMANVREPSQNKPDFHVRARQEKNSRFFTTIGAAWRKTDRNTAQELVLLLRP